MFRTIMVAVDGSEHGLKAAQIAGDVARSMKADLWVVVAYEPIPTYLGEPNLQEAITARLALSDSVLEEAEAAIGDIPGVLKQEVLEGPPAEAILAVADTRAVDLIVMGTRGLGLLASIVVGSQSQKVIANAKCPVLLVR
jgi:nucleotide-binding universal stress UspA family protein